MKSFSRGALLTLSLVVTGTSCSFESESDLADQAAADLRKEVERVVAILDLEILDVEVQPAREAREPFMQGRATEAVDGKVTMTLGGVPANPQDPVLKAIENGLRSADYEIDATSCGTPTSALARSTRDDGALVIDIYPTSGRTVLTAEVGLDHERHAPADVLFPSDERESCWAPS